ncbi:MAG TPA: helix-turn-helix transcriptional regulator [Candidatus Saccharimonadales bacterium]|jgi:DNA-binding PadR family transcriptional regulator|nr:helix-turn-helix transcriptional regulator [Candidatus Saccharimonadales bacterium]
MKRSIELLPQLSFCILLALSLRPRHGYEIIQQVEQDSLGRVRVGAGGLYVTIQKLIDQGLIEETQIDGNRRRRYYQLTDEGKSRLHAELAYYTNVSQLTRLRLSLENSSSL